MPARARTSWMFESIFLYTESFSAIATTGSVLSMSAFVPCFISPAAVPSAWMYESSLSLSAPSSAVG